MPTSKTSLTDTALPQDAGKDDARGDSRYKTAHVHLQVREDLVREDTLEGRAYIVAPVVPITEGVHNGEFISFEEIAFFPEAWDGRPLPIDHPKDKNGIPQTANSPEVLESQVIGQLFNVVARPDIRGISGELWIDVAKAGEVPGGASVLDRLQSGGQLEVSTGYFTLVDDISGEFNGESFVGSQRDVRPDHLALLPEDTGACSWEDGCGAPRINQEKAIMPDPSTETGTVRVNGEHLGTVLSAMLTAQSSGGGIDDELVNRLAVAASIEPAKVLEVANGSVDFVPLQWLRVFGAVLGTDPFDLILSADADTAGTRQAPSVFKADQVTQSAEQEDQQALETNEESDEESEDAPVAVNGEKEPCGPCHKTLKDRVQEIVNNVLATLNIGQHSTETNSMTIDERVEALITNESTRFSEDNREWLKGLTEDQLGLIEPQASEETAEEVVETQASTGTQEVGEPETVVEETAETVEETQAAAAAATLSKEAVLEAIGLTTDAIDSINASVQASRDKRDAQVKELAANEACPFSEGQLKAMADDAFETVREAYASDESGFYTRPGSRKVENVDQSVPPSPAILLAPVDAKS